MQFMQQPNQQEPLTINELARDIKLGQVTRINVAEDDSLQVIYGTGEGAIERESKKEPNSTLVEQLVAHFLDLAKERNRPDLAAGDAGVARARRVWRAIRRVGRAWDGGRGRRREEAA